MHASYQGHLSIASLLVGIMCRCMPAIKAMLVLHHPVRGLCADACQGNVSIASLFAGIMCRCVSGHVSITSPFAGIMCRCVSGQR